MIPNVYGAQAGLKLLGAIGVETIEREVASLTARLIAWADDAGVEVITPSESTRRGPLVVLRSVDAVTLVARLAARGVIASSRDEGIRISFHGYNTQEDLDSVIASLEAESAMLRRSRFSQTLGSK